MVFLEMVTEELCFLAIFTDNEDICNARHLHDGNNNKE